MMCIMEVSISINDKEVRTAFLFTYYFNYGAYILMLLVHKILTLNFSLITMGQTVHQFK